MSDLSTKGLTSETQRDGATSGRHPRDSQIDNARADGKRARLRGTVAECLVRSVEQIDREQLAHEIELARGKVGEAVAEFLERAYQRKRADGPRRPAADRVLVEAPAGIGKTHEFVRHAERYALELGLRILYLAPTHELLAEVAKKMRGAKLVEGREREGQ
jgi:superfamily II DNA or RNA helicase